MGNSLDADASYQEWLSMRPAAIQALAQKMPPDRTYRIKSTGQICRLMSYSEFKDGGVGFQVVVLPGQSFLFPEGHRVFGLKEEDIEEVNEAKPAE